MMYLYFIQAGGDGPIKIGLAVEPEHRLDDLQVGNYEPLTLLAVMPGTLALERELHQRFSTGHLRGEWFDPDTPGLKQEIAQAVQVEAHVAFHPGHRLCVHCGLRPVLPPRTRLCSAECEQERKRQTSAEWRRRRNFIVAPEQS